jgi:hypothetical protein
MRYVMCCERCLWHLKLWKPGQEGKVKRVPYKCHSWRHPGECAAWKAAQDYCRVFEAVKKRNDWFYLVLTYAQSDWPDWKQQYVDSCRIWAALHKRMQRAWGKCDYIQTWERHRAGGLHCNVLVGNKAIDAIVRADFRPWRRDWLKPNAAECGFGKVLWVTPFRHGTADSMAGYLTKLANELIGSSEKGQIPFDAPRHFRRLRATRGLLPPIIKSDYTGSLEMFPIPFGKESKEDDLQPTGIVIQ